MGVHMCANHQTNLLKLLNAGLEFEDAVSCLDAYERNPQTPGADAIRAKAIIEKDSNEQQ